MAVYTATSTTVIPHGQSPLAINLSRCPKQHSLPALKFEGHWDACINATLKNNGQTAYFTVKNKVRPILSGGPLTHEYVFEQLHFHWSIDDYTGCEHVLNGKGFASEAHLVHYNSKYNCIDDAVNYSDGLCVVGVLLEVADVDNLCFGEIAQALERITAANSETQLSKDSLVWLKECTHSQGYVTYKGSLTTPPYSECVTWILYDTPITLSHRQVDLFRALEDNSSTKIERNVRQTQKPPSGHTITYVKQFQNISKL